MAKNTKNCVFYLLAARRSPFSTLHRNSIVPLFPRRRLGRRAPEPRPYCHLARCHCPQVARVDSFCHKVSLKVIVILVVLWEMGLHLWREEGTNFWKSFLSLEHQKLNRLFGDFLDVCSIFLLLKDRNVFRFSFFKKVSHEKWIFLSDFEVIPFVVR